MQIGNDDYLRPPVACFSTAVQPSQKNWSATTIEAYSLVFAQCSQALEVHFVPTMFVLNSDHNPLIHLREQKHLREVNLLVG